MGNRLKPSLSIVRRTSFPHSEAVRDHFGCIHILSSVDGIVPDPWSGACDRMCFILNTALFSLHQKDDPSPFICSLGCCHAVPLSVQCVGFFLWPFVGLPSPGYCLPLGSSDFRLALFWEQLLPTWNKGNRGWVSSNDSCCWINGFR